jgi:hypothetical protein
MTETIEDVCADEPEAVAWVIHRLAEASADARARLDIDGAVAEASHRTLVNGALAAALAFIAKACLERHTDALATHRAELLDWVQRLGEVDPVPFFDARDHLLAAPGDGPPARVYRALGAEVAAAVEASLALALE